MEARAAPSNDSLEAHQKNYNSIRTDYEALGKNLEEFSIDKKQTDEESEKIDSLSFIQKDFKTKVDGYYQYADAFHRQCYFGRSRERVRADLEYALARALKMSSQREVTKEIQKTEEKTKEINKKIEKLKEQIKNK